MPEVRDPALKLFGRTIPLLESREMAAVKICSHLTSVSVEEKNASEMETACSEAEECSDNEEEGTKSEQGKKKTLPKPDKILPCPRCNSCNTKFCYYNNYNVNQPRHFCKNCQRYWTAGGTMRNVPVGAGRRKNKNAAVHRRSSKNDENSSGSSSAGADCEAVESSATATATAAAPPPFPCYPWPVPPPPFCGPFPLMPGFFCYPWSPPAAPPEKSTTGSLWIPKTLRIDDPDEAAKSSIWATLGIKPDPKICSGGIFRGFDHKPTSVDQESQGVKVNHINPAALSRSQAFKEST